MGLMRYLRTPLDLPLLFFVVSALIGVWASYDRAASWAKFGLIVAALAIFYAVVLLRAGPQLLEPFVWLFLIGSAALAVYSIGDCVKVQKINEAVKSGYYAAMDL